MKPSKSATTCGCVCKKPSDPGDFVRRTDEKSYVVPVVDISGSERTKEEAVKTTPVVAI